MLGAGQRVKDTPSPCEAVQAGEGGQDRQDVVGREKSTARFVFHWKGAAFKADPSSYGHAEEIYQGHGARGLLEHEVHSGALHANQERGEGQLGPRTRGEESWSFLFSLHWEEMTPRMELAVMSKHFQTGATRLLLVGLVQQHIYFLANRHGVLKE